MSQGFSLLFKGLYSGFEAPEISSFCSQVLVLGIRRLELKGCVAYELLEGLSPTFGSKVFGGLCSGSEIHGFFEGFCSRFFAQGVWKPMFKV